MSRSNALKQLISAKRILHPNQSISDLIKDVRKLPYYNRKSYHYLYITITRIIDGLKKKSNYKPRESTIRTKQNIKLVSKILKQKKGTRKASIRGVKSVLKTSYNINISYGSVRKIITEDLNMKFIRYRRSQKLTQTHKDARVVCAQYLRKKYGVRPTGKNYGWDKIINTDFSAPLRCRRRLNSQNDGLWVPKEIDMAGEEIKIKSNKGYEKYSKGFMLFGGICSEGLLPRDEPVFFTEWLHQKCEEINKEKKTLNNVLYAEFIEDYFVPILEDDLNEDLDEYIWQDDGDKKHRTAHVLSQFKSVFNQRIDPKRQCDKMADVWVIENVWAILYEKLRGQEFDDIEDLKKEVIRIWREIDASLCKKMMRSIPYRLKAVIDNNGEQITKYDYK